MQDHSLSVGERDASPIRQPSQIEKSGSNLKLYTFLANRRWPRTYRGKIMFVAFLGTHVPLLTLLAMTIMHSAMSPQAKAQVLLTSLIATLVGTAATLYLLNRLLAPVLLTAQALRGYLRHQVRPALPTLYSDEAGALMADTMQTVGQLDDMIEYLKGYDALTGLPNREKFKEHLEQAVATARRQNSSFAVLIVDLDGFALLNSGFGQSTGDQVLREVGKRLQGSIRETDFLARLSADQFAILHTDSNPLEGVFSHIQRILSSLEHPISTDQKEWHGSACIGVALYPDDYDAQGSHLLEHADAALHIAKEAGPNGYQFFATETNEKLKRRVELASDLRCAVERDEFVLHYQPQVDGANGRVVGMEALVRWQHPQYGCISPLEFIPIAEASGIIVPLGEWILRTACLQNKKWQRENGSDFRISVNLSARQFQQPNLVSRVISILEETDLESRFLELEITESMVMSDVENAISVLHNLHSHGIALSLDDFGTGYSSLSYLKRFPLTALKIDRSFVKDLTQNTNDAVITSSIIALAQSLDLNVIAEGVETLEQSAFLQSKGCHKLQGYYYSRPATAEQCDAMLQKGNLKENATQG